MSPRTALLATATAASWTALLTVGVAAGASALLAVASALVSLGVWHRLGGWLSTVPALGCVLMLASGRVTEVTVAAAGAAAVLVLVHVVLVDLTDDVQGATAGAVGSALRRLLPGAVAALVATVLVGFAAVAGGALPPVEPLLVAAPLLLLAAFLLGLGMATRRAFWGLLVKPSRLSPMTRRYLARAGLRP